MNLKEAAQQALEALEYIHTETSAYEDELIHAAIIALRAALEPVTTCHELYKTACANATYKVIDYFCHTTACSDVNVTYIRKILDEFAEQAICCKGGDKLSLPFDHFADAGKMVATGQESRQVEPVGYGVFEDGNLHDSFRLEHEAKLFAAFKGDHAEVLPLYTAPLNREPMTDEEIHDCF